MISQADIRSFYDLQPVVPLSQGWQILVFVVLLAFILAFIIWLYIRDSRSLPVGLTVLLSSLRVTAFICVLIYVLNPGHRIETRVVKTSRLPVLVDTSLSMGLQDSTAPGLITARRIDKVNRWLESQTELNTLRMQHDLEIYRFGESARPELIASFSKTGSNQAPDPEFQGNLDQHTEDQLEQSRRVGWLAIVLAAFSAAVGVSLLFARTNADPSSRANRFCLSTLAFVAMMATLALSDLASPQFGLLTSMGWKEPASTASADRRSVSDDQRGDFHPTSDLTDWPAVLSPTGTSTQLGSAIEHIVNKERGGPIAGIVVITDGQSNEGAQPTRAIASAANAGIPIYPIGIGAATRPKNVVVADIQAPPRVFPSDEFKVKGILKAYGMAGTVVQVQLASVDEDETEAEAIEEVTSIKLADDGEPISFEFDVANQNQGRRRYSIRVIDVPDDFDLRDNQRTAIVEIVERQTKVLLMAGGPNREFRFLRNQLFRDQDVLLHVWLQSSKTGADQEADVLLSQFPQSNEDLSFYDCIIAFDPDWRQLTTDQTESLERWVAEKAGGLIVIAGPVNTPLWTQRPKGDKAIDQIRNLYPVSFYSQGTAQLKLGRFGGDEAFPLDFSREGRAASFLWLGDAANESQANWGTFAGVFGYYAVNEPKPGADILAHFADPSTAVNDRLPIYLASHFYGAGRVFFQASGEMWRIRQLNVDFFQQYYTKLVRWVSQGRLLRDSTKGVLIVNRERCWMGDQVRVQAVLRDAQDVPLQLAEVEATLIDPIGLSTQFKLSAMQNAVRPGTFQGQFTTNAEGQYKINLPIPFSPNLEVLTKVVEANIPDLEKERPQRNDALLSELAEKTNGHLFSESSIHPDASPDQRLSQFITPQDQEMFLAGTRDLSYQRKLMMWLMGLFALCLSFEWTFRRLHKLA